MNHHRHNYTVNLKGVRSKAQKRLDRLRREARGVSIKDETVTIQEVQQRDVVGESLRVLGVVVIMLCSWTYVPSINASLSYFMDTEGTPSQMASGYIDLITTYEQEVLELECGGMKDSEVTLESTGNSANVRASTTSVVGSMALCDSLELDVRHLGETLYTGPLSGFYAEDILDGTMRFIVSLPTNAGPFSEGAQCTTSIEYLASQERHSEAGTGFTDSEVVQLVYSVDTLGCESCVNPCTTCGDLYVDVENVNIGVIINDIDVSSGTGGNDSSGGGDIITGNAESEVIIENVLNTNETTIIQNCECGCCESDKCVCDEGCGEETSCGEIEADDTQSTEEVIEITNTNVNDVEDEEIDVEEMIENKKEEMLSNFEFPRR